MTDAKDDHAAVLEIEDHSVVAESIAVRPDSWVPQLARSPERIYRGETQAIDNRRLVLRFEFPKISNGAFVKTTSATQQGVKWSEMPRVRFFASLTNRIQEGRR